METTQEHKEWQIAGFVVLEDCIKTQETFTRYYIANSYNQACDKFHADVKNVYGKMLDYCGINFCMIFNGNN